MSTEATPATVRLTDELGPLVDSEEDPARLWAEIHLLRAAVQGLAGYATWQEAAAERVRRVNAEAQCEDCAASEQRWIDWLVKHGLLHYYDFCQRPDGSNGPAWVLHTPHMANGYSCEAWHAVSAAGALRAFLRA